MFQLCNACPPQPRCDLVLASACTPRIGRGHECRAAARRAQGTVCCVCGRSPPQLNHLGIKSTFARKSWPINRLWRALSSSSARRENDLKQRRFPTRGLRQPEGLQDKQSQSFYCDTAHSRLTRSDLSQVFFFCSANFASTSQAAENSSEEDDYSRGRTGRVSH